MNFRIHDPYAVPGEYKKVQLHCHTTESDGSIRPPDLLRMYKDAGYAFVFITDHNRVTRCPDFDDDRFLALPGTEDTVSHLLPPLGPHLGRLFVDEPTRRGTAQERIDRTLETNGIASLCHPTWTGNLWTGTWSLHAITELRGFHFMEIVNPHSDTQKDVARWEIALRNRGLDTPVWAVAVDDCHRADQFNRGWIMVRVAEHSAAALHDALHHGAFYASTGPEGRFQIESGAIIAEFSEALEVRMIDRHGLVRASAHSKILRHPVEGTEGYLRVEASSRRGGIWSQPFWISRDPV